MSSNPYQEVYATSLNRSTERMFGQAIMQQISLQAQLDAASAQLSDLQSELAQEKAKNAAQAQMLSEVAKRHPDDPELAHLVGPSEGAKA